MFCSEGDLFLVSRNGMCQENTPFKDAIITLDAESLPISVGKEAYVEPNLINL